MLLFFSKQFQVLCCQEKLYKVQIFIFWDTLIFFKRVLKAVFCLYYGKPNIVALFPFLFSVPVFLVK